MECILSIDHLAIDHLAIDHLAIDHLAIDHLAIDAKKKFVVAIRFSIAILTSYNHST